ncbi:P-loop containing nucleoside triphosphate hydrolase protein [Mollisia scopiformis]|uniref:p-loop containing nucleoside triphosphate hydrolase protein n=1 Tax=Mollisia scopiformis TaxID=149040 RepID=A0A132B4U4_MOLSC|nr:P-loop containing nucleoside triphosphate hydrolase protein [Mollisia scopiformis]KUJ07428.1 P-loop containing nucleoside triphosphate hydrolase protein [Mollisia scopiformis]
MAQSLEAKIVVLGSQGVGKTSLVHRYVKNEFAPVGTTSTVGASFLTKRVVDEDSDTTVRLQIWDTAGQERFRSISRLYYRSANACILCYSITDLSSFEEMGVWLAELRRNLPADIILHVVGTKSDIVARDPSLRQVPFERCIAYVADNLAPGMSSTPPATATPGSSGGILEGMGGGGMYGGNWLGQGGRNSNNALDGARSPSSKRSSGFWGQEVGWDCCHEVSAENGEGVEEVFRVISRKLVEQNRKLTDGLASAAQTPNPTPGLDGGDGYFDHMRPGGSFRVGRDRRSWFGVQVESYIEETEANGTAVDRHVKTRRKCC